MSFREFLTHAALGAYVPRFRSFMKREFALSDLDGDPRPYYNGAMHAMNGFSFYLKENYSEATHSFNYSFFEFYDTGDIAPEVTIVRGLASWSYLHFINLPVFVELKGWMENVSVDEILGKFRNLVIGKETVGPLHYHAKMDMLYAVMGGMITLEATREVWEKCHAR